MIDYVTVPYFFSVIFKIRDAFLSTMFLLHKGSDNTISIPNGYVRDIKIRVECGLCLVKLLLGIRIQRQNQLYLRHSSVILVDVANLIHRQIYQ